MYEVSSSTDTLFTLSLLTQQGYANHTTSVHSRCLIFGECLYLTQESELCQFNSSSSLAVAVVLVQDPPMREPAVDSGLWEMRIKCNTD
jgi:hypothetical protein